MPSKPLRLAALISGGGRTVLNLHQRIEKGSLDAKIDVVVSSRSDVAGVERSRQAGLNTVVVERRRLEPDAFQEQITKAVAGVDLVCMGGFLSLWLFPDEFYGRVMNIHPALLPAFPGVDGYGDTFRYGCKVGGCTVHFIDYGEDTGPIIGQRAFPISDDDTIDSIRKKGLELEWELYPKCIQMFAEGRLKTVKKTFTLDNGQKIRRTIVEILPKAKL